VLAVEPQLLCLQYLAAAITKMEVVGIRLCQNILAADPTFHVDVPVDLCRGTSQFTPNGIMGDAAVKKSFHNSSGKSMLVSSISLDKLVGFETIELWHLDTEGAEVSVIRSARALLESDRVRRVTFEWSPWRWKKFGVLISEGVKELQTIFTPKNWICKCFVPERLFDWKHRGPQMCVDVSCARLRH